MSRPFIVCDLEATCWDPDEYTQTVDMMEIIEIGAVKTNASGKIFDSFTVFIRPTENPTLTDFCVNLTGITQADVDAAPDYEEAVDQFNEWLGDIRGNAWLSWGNFDHNLFLAEFNRHAVAPNIMWIPHVNLKRPWRKTTKHKRQGLGAALAFHGYEFEGQHHRGIDDARNIARLLPHVDSHLLRLEIEEWKGSHVPGRPDFRFL